MDTDKSDEKHTLDDSFVEDNTIPKVISIAVVLVKSVYHWRHSDLRFFPVYFNKLWCIVGRYYTHFVYGIVASSPK